MTLALTLALACAGPPAGEPPPAPSPSLPAPAPPPPAADVARREFLRTYLAPDARDRLERRAWLARLGEVRLTPDGPAILKGSGAPVTFEQLIVVDDGPRIGVIVGDMSPVRMFVYLDPTDLAEVVTREVKLSQSSSRNETDDLGVYLRPGARVTVVERRDAAVRVVDECRDLDSEGWVPPDALARIFPRQPEVDGDRDDTNILSGSHLTLRPGGPPVAVFQQYDPRDFVYPAVRLGKPRRGWQRVEYLADDCRARGWIATTNLSDDGTDLWGGLGLTQQKVPCDDTTERVTLDPGILLVHADSRLPFAVVAERTTLFRSTGARLCLPTFWGPVDVTPFADPEQLRAAGSATPAR